MKNIVLNLIAISLLSSCSEKTSKDPNEVYELWSGSKPTNKVKVLNGRYWESAHWTKEYVLFLELETEKEFWTVFMEKRDLMIDTIKVSHSISDQPEWFKPSKSSVKYKVNGEFDQGSRYYQDSIHGRIYIYEVQL